MTFLSIQGFFLKEGRREEKKREEENNRRSLEEKEEVGGEKEKLHAKPLGGHLLIELFHYYYLHF